MRSCSSTSPSAHTRACFSASSTSPLGHAERRAACAISPLPWTGKRATYRSRTATVGLSRRGHSIRPGKPNPRPAPQRVRDLGDTVDLLHERTQTLGRRITLYIDLIDDLCRDSRISGEVATRAHPDPPQRDGGRLRLPEQIVGHAPRNGQLQQLATVQAKPAAASASGTVDDDGVRTGRTDRRRLIVQASRLDLEWHRERSRVGVGIAEVWIGGSDRFFAFVLLACALVCFGRL